jgi:hypothetical protein
VSSSRDLSPVEMICKAHHIQDICAQEVHQPLLGFPEFRELFHVSEDVGGDEASLSYLPKTCNLWKLSPKMFTFKRIKFSEMYLIILKMFFSKLSGVRQITEVGSIEA